MVDINDRRGPRPLYNSVDEIKDAHKGQWFSPENQKYFGSRVGNKVIGGTHFVTSEKHPADEGGWQRKYSVRAANDKGDISTVGDFGGYGNRREAMKAAQQAVADSVVEKHPNDSYVRGK